MVDFWVCAACRSINRPQAGKCYSCRARRDALPTDAAPSAPPTPKQAPATGAGPAPPEPRPFASPAPKRVAAPKASAAPRPISTPKPIADVPASAQPHRGVLVKRAPVGGVVVVAIAVLVAGGVLVAMRGSGPPQEALNTLTGRLDLVQGRSGQLPSFASNDGRSCFGVGAFRDVRLGMPISVENSDGTLVGEGWLDDGQIAPDASAQPGASAEPATCSFRFQADIRPATTYRVIPGNRDPIERSADQLAEAGWTLSITIKP